jgi:ABC-type sugar transport system permease subunit
MNVRTKPRRKARLSQEIQWYSFIIPSILCLVMLTYGPLITSVRYSFYRIAAVGLEGTFVGLKNYAILFQSTRFLNAISNTVVLAVLSLIAIPAGFILAIMLQSLRKSKLQSFFRMAFYLPNIITGVSIILMFRYILLTDGGLLNSALSIIAGREISIGWFTDVNVTKFSATILSAWSGIGYAMLINLAGLQSIPGEIYEAADIDGCNARQRLIYITMPNMVNTFSFLLITRFISGFSRFADLYILCGNSPSGAPNYSLQTILMYVYQNSFVSPNYGLASATAMIFFLILFLITLLNLKLTNFGSEK